MTHDETINTKTKQTAVEWLFEKINDALIEFSAGKISAAVYGIRVTEYKYQAKQMEKEQMGYTKKDILKAGEIGEINHYDCKHIVKLLDEAKEINRKIGNPDYL